MLGGFPSSWSPFSRGLNDTMAIPYPQRPALGNDDGHVECVCFFPPYKELCYGNITSFTLRMSQKIGARKTFLVSLYKKAE